MKEDTMIHVGDKIVLLYQDELTRDDWRYELLRKEEGLWWVKNPNGAILAFNPLNPNIKFIKNVENGQADN